MICSTQFGVTYLFACLLCISVKQTFSSVTPPPLPNPPHPFHGVRGRGLASHAILYLQGTPQLHLARLDVKQALCMPLCIVALKSRGPLKVCFLSPSFSCMVPPHPTTTYPNPPSSGQKTECDVSSPSPHKAPVHWTHLGQHKG